MARLSSAPLDVCKAPLTGINLIEASAGTGKTRTITDLYVRCIVETEHQVHQMLVVTFTVAATAELRARIRQRLVEAYQAVSGQPTSDAFLQQLCALSPPQEMALQRLDNALKGFDEAAISTIHGLCERVLGDWAFEHGAPFEQTLLTDERELLQDIVDDFWRCTLYNASPLFVRYVLDSGATPEQLLETIRPYVGKPDLTMVLPTSETNLGHGPTLAHLETAFARAYGEVHALWQSAATEVAELLSAAPGLNRNSYRPSSIPAWCAEMDTYLALETPNPQLCQTFERFTTRRLASAVKKGAQPPQHLFFATCDALAMAHAPLQASYHAQLYALKVGLFAYCQRELGLRKRRRRLLSYDDMLVHVERTLTGPHGQTLAASLRRRYPVALIDEFQDTDPVQYRIFQRIYHGTTAPVFFVGDPKQAIYSFRGADLFAYLQACRTADQRYTLDVNWRADPTLLQAINTLFSAVPHPFLFADIPFHPAQPAPQRPEGLTEHGQQVSQLRVWFLEGEANGQAVPKYQAEALAAQATAAEIARLLTLGARGAAQLGTRPLAGGDIAVLVRSHRQGHCIQEALLRLRVASVQMGQDNVFASGEALELERVLRAVAQPGSAAFLRSALATVLLGVTGESLAVLHDDEQRWEDRLAAFQEYHRVWREDGFARMWRTLVAAEQVERRLLGFQGGERRLTNLRHLTELLQVAADRQRTGMAGLLTWLAARRQDYTGEETDEQLRLESDEHLVKIVTIHKSKGLEYPMVFCPFLWSGGLWTRKGGTLAFHHPDEAYEPCLDLGSSQLDASRVYAGREEMAENLRLLYVALTRAKHCCYLVWGAINDLGTSPLAWLLHQPASADGTLTLDALEAHVKARSAADLRGDVERWVARAQGSIALAPLPIDAGEPYQLAAPTAPLYAARAFPGPFRRPWWVTSFSALAAGAASGAELPDYDALARPSIGEPSALEAQTIFTFPRGVRAGRCFHAIFERLDFTADDRSALDSLVTDSLAIHGFDATWLPVVAATVERVVTAPLDTTGTLSLRQIPCTRRLIELEFYYPLAALTCEGLQRLLQAHGFAVMSLRDN
ncbi:MAG: exodeoxyribonuclease V subunit beta, partial [Candidatus Tectimicrobiota bacterium]